MGVACRGGVVAVATATLMCACRDRRSVFRRMVPLTNYEGWGYLNSARGGRSCGGERPGRPPTRAGSLAGQGCRSPGLPGRARGDHRSGCLCAAVSWSSRPRRTPRARGRLR